MTPIATCWTCMWAAALLWGLPSWVLSLQLCMAPVGVGLTASYAALLSHIQKSQASAVNTLAAFDVAVEQFRVLTIWLDQFKRSKVEQEPDRLS